MMVATKKLASKNNGLVRCTLAAAIAALLATGFPVIARADAIDNLLEKLKAKGVISEEEYQEVLETREGEKAVARKRKQEQSEKDTKAEERAKTEMVGSFSDGLRLETADKKNSISLGGRIQLDYRNFSGDDALIANTFDVRRAYLTVQGKFWDYYTFDLTGDFAGLAGSTQVQTNTSASTCTSLPCTDPNTTSATLNSRQSSHLDVAWFNAAWWQSAQLRFGQFKMPMSLEEQTSSRFLDFQERSIMNAFVPAKERGIMLHGTPTPGLFYGVAISTGEGKNNNENTPSVDGNDFIGRVGVNIAEFVGQKNAVYHLAGAYSIGKIAPSSPPTGRTEGRGVNFFTTAEAFSGGDVERTRTGLEAAVAYGPIKFQGEYLKANYSGHSADIASAAPGGAITPGIDYDRGIDVWYAGVNWLISGETYADNYKNGAFGRIRPKANFSPSGTGWGAWELGVRYTNFDASDFKTTNQSGTGKLSGNATNKVSAYTLGVKWMPTPNTRFLLNYVKSDFDKTVTQNSKKTDDEKAITFRAQFDF